MSTATLRPNANGNYTQWGVWDTDHWAAVDEEEADDTTTCIYDGVQGQRDSFAFEDLNQAGATINWVQVTVRAKSTATAEHEVGIFYREASTDYANETTQVADDSAYQTYSLAAWKYTTNPATSNPWTPSEIDAMEWGVKMAVDGGKGSLYITQVYVEVDYTAGATEKTSSDSGSGVDVYVSLETPEAKTSSDTGSGVEGTPMQSATLAGSETGSGIEALVARLLAVVDTGYGVEAGDVEVEGLLKDLFASELGEGSDSLAAKIEIPTKGGGMRLWT